MEITPIQWLAGVAGIVAFVTIYIGRVVRHRDGAIEHIAWAALAAASGFGAVKCGYPLYRFIRYRSVDQIANVYEYILIGLGIGLVSAIVAIVKSWSSRMPE